MAQGGRSAPVTGYVGGDFPVQQANLEKLDASRRSSGHTASRMPGRGPLKKRLKAGRNDPGPCSSGRKYKRCCGANWAG